MRDNTHLITTMLKLIINHRRTTLASQCLNCIVTPLTQTAFMRIPRRLSISRFTPKLLNLLYHSFHLYSASCVIKNARGVAPKMAGNPPLPPPPSPKALAKVGCEGAFCFRRIKANISDAYILVARENNSFASDKSTCRASYGAKKTLQS